MLCQDKKDLSHWSSHSQDVKTQVVNKKMMMKNRKKVKGLKRPQVISHHNTRQTRRRHEPKQENDESVLLRLMCVVQCYRWWVYVTKSLHKVLWIRVSNRPFEFRERDRHDFSPTIDEERVPYLLSQMLHHFLPSSLSRSCVSASHLSF